MKIEYKGRGIWEITGFKFHDIDISEISKGWVPWCMYPTDNREVIDKTTLPSGWYIDIKNQLAGLTGLLRKEINNDKIIKYMWPRGLDNIDLNSNHKWELLKCPPNFKMGKHIDNREVLGVIIINLVDNAEGSGTKIGSYTAPNKKGTGVFFLNSQHTEHMIENKSMKPRYVFYSTISIWPMSPDLNSQKYKKFLDWNRRNYDS
tara:strand:- start:980 stop:1591 length:612 start_codon:yes stop_codon:yes gene_type:complete